VFKDLFALTKPRLNFMVLLSALAGYELGRSQPFDLFKFVEFAAALFMLAGASSALNMWIERDQDSRMGRTASRPLAAGRLSPGTGLAFGLVLTVLSLAWLALRFNVLTAWLGGLTWASYLFVYTPLKRLSSLSTLVGAIPGALPPVMGWSAATNSLGQPALALFAVLFLWQIPHFLAIAVMYEDEYKSAGFKVMPFEQGIAATGRQMVLYALALIPVSLWVFVQGLSGKAYFFTAFVLGLAYAAMAFYAAGFSGRQRARRLLLASVLYLPLLFTVMLADRISWAPN
jgi:protoheme IX farnesyltransferase